MSTLQGKSRVVSFTPTISTSAYAEADQVGDLQELSAVMDCPSTGAILSVTIIDKDSQNSTLDVLFFSKEVTVASSDNDPLDVSDSELEEKYLGSVRVSSGDYRDLANNSVATIGQVGILLDSIKSIPDNRKALSIWAIVRSGGTPTYTSTSGLVVKVGILLD